MPAFLSKQAQRFLEEAFCQTPIPELLQATVISNMGYCLLLLSGSFHLLQSVEDIFLPNLEMEQFFSSNPSQESITVSPYHMRQRVGEARF